MTALTLRWFDKALHPNHRTHYHAKAKAYRAAKEYAKLMASTVAAPSVVETVPLSLVFCPPTAARRDLDNCLSSCKAFLDGIAEAWGVNDSQFRPIMIDFGAKVKGGAVKIEVLA